jgi:hypothetical protein
MYDHHIIFFTFNVVFTNQRFSSCSSTVDVGLVKLLLNVFVEKRSLRWESSSAVTLAAAVLRLSDTHSAMYGDPFHSA